MAELSSEQGPPVEADAPTQHDELLSTARTLPADEEDHEDTDDIDPPCPSPRRPDSRCASPELDPSHHHHRAHGHSHRTSRDMEAALDVSSSISRSSYSSSASSPASTATTATSASTAAAALAGTAALRSLPAGRKTFRATAPAPIAPSSCTVKAGRYVRNIGLFFLAVGLLTLGAAILSHTLLPEWRDKKALRALVVDSTEHPAYATWADPSSKAGGGGDSPMYQTFYFFHLVNPSNFVQQGEKPVYLEKGPYTFQQKKKKVEVEFSEDGNIVSYVTLVQNEYVPVRSLFYLLPRPLLYLSPSFRTKLA